MTWFLLGLGLVLVIEGLALALAPSRIEQLLAFFAALSPERRRSLGLAAVATGVLLVWTARQLAGAP
ncbi:MAG: DUF2065 domain-containing protein [Fuscovulum sp.]|jgi:uncharacterized protein YjeT (DUF2065 family)|nr:MAG: DUF2065 domain-containing protein [Fuscovulum sp.]